MRFVSKTVFAACLGLVVVFLSLPAFAGSLTDDPNAVFPVEEVVIETGSGSFKFSAEIADEPDERARGLMAREVMPPTHGMLFDFGKNAPVAMWMANTPLSLDMVFIRKDGTVARIASRTTPFSREVIASGEPVTHVLELNGGISAQIGLKIGDRIRHAYFGNAE